MIRTRLKQSAAISKNINIPINVLATSNISMRYIHSNTIRHRYKSIPVIVVQSKFQFSLLSNSHYQHQYQYQSQSHYLLYRSFSSTPNPIDPKHHIDASTTHSTAINKQVEPILPLSTRAWRFIKKEAQHYWTGTKLLYADIRVAYALSKSVLKGHELTRRERKQLQRTTADIIRLVPFAVIVIVPFMEFSLPVLLKLFPNMLPSTYLDTKGEEVKLQKQLSAKIEMAKFLQETTALMAAQIADKKHSTIEQQSTAEQFKQFMVKVRSGQTVRNEEILKFSSLFDEEFTMENLTKNQLVAMCKLLDIRPFGGDWVLRYKLKQKLKELKDDDKWISREGIESLTEIELIEACRARGIHTGQSIDYMSRKLNDWLELSLKHNVPATLLVLSRAFSSRMANINDTLADTLRYIPEAVVADTEDSIKAISTDAKEKLELLDKERKEQKLKAAAEKAAADKIETATTVSNTSTASASIESIPAAPIKAKKVSFAVNLADAKEKLQELESENDELAEDIDELELKAKRAAEAASEAKKIRAELSSAINSANQAVKSASAAAKPTTTENESKPLESVAAVEKELKKVDQLNEKLASLLDNLSDQIERADSKLSEDKPEKKSKKESNSNNNNNNTNTVAQ